MRVRLPRGRERVRSSQEKRGRLAKGIWKTMLQSEASGLRAKYEREASGWWKKTKLRLAGEAVSDGAVS